MKEIDVEGLFGALDSAKPGDKIKLADHIKEKRTLKRRTNMKTQHEYWETLKVFFQFHLASNANIFAAHNYQDNRYYTYIKQFYASTQNEGLKISKPYHANGIGNNHEYIIYKEDVDQNGFPIEKKVAEFYYCTGIYGGVFVRMTDLATGEKIEFGRAH